MIHPPSATRRGKSLCGDSRPRLSAGRSPDWSFKLISNKFILCLVGLLLLASCSPRDFLSRRLARDLISASDAFRDPQHFALQTGLVSNEVYLAPEYLVLQHHGWISATNAACRTGLAPPPCWEILLTPSGVDTVRALVPSDEASKPSFAIPVARRELVEITGVSKQGNVAEVDFTWKWVPLNEIGAVLYSSAVHYKSTAGFRNYDDGWRIVVAQSAPHVAQTLEDALKQAEPAP